MELPLGLDVIAIGGEPRRRPLARTVTEIDETQLGQCLYQERPRRGRKTFHGNSIDVGRARELGEKRADGAVDENTPMRDASRFQRHPMSGGSQKSEAGQTNRGAFRYRDRLEPDIHGRRLDAQ